MTTKEQARDLMLRLPTMDGTPDEIIGLIVHSLEQAIAAERERCARFDLMKRVREFFKAKPSPPLDICPACGGPTEHICSFACVDFCRRCDGLEQ